MSLHQLAQNMAAQGRGPDTMLMHVAPDEVARLQHVAEQNGTSLTINPHTGLPEAFGLSDLNPFKEGSATNKIVTSPIGQVAMGAMLGPAGYGLSAGMAGLAVGGIGALASGNLKSGLAAGMAAFGGASIGGTLAGAGGLGESAIGGEAKAATLMNGGTEAAAAQNAADATSNASVWDKTAAGAQSAFNNPKGALTALGGGNALTGAGIASMAALPVLSQLSQPKAVAIPSGAISPSLIRPYTYSRQSNYDPATQMVGGKQMIGASYDANPNSDTSERNWFNDKYTAGTPYEAPGPEYKKAAEGGIMRLAEGGTATDQNVIDYGLMPRYSYDPLLGIYTLLPPKKSDATTAPIDTFTSNFVGSDSGGGDSASSTAADGGQSGEGVGVSDAGIGAGPASSDAASAASDSAAGVGSAGPGGSSGDSAAAAGGAGPGGPGGASSDGSASSSDGAASGDGGGTGGGTGGTGGAAGGDGGASGSSGGASGGDGGEAKGGLAPHFPRHMASGGLGSLDGYAAGGAPYSLGSYSDGGRLLKGPGDGMSDNIPAQIGQKQPARLADGEFVVPADVVSHLGNGSTDAGAKQLYKMMDKIRAARTGRKTQGKQINPNKFLPK